MITSEKRIIDVPLGSFCFEKNLLARKMIFWAGYNFVYNEVEKIMDMKDWGKNIVMPTKISWLLAGGSNNEAEFLKPINLDLVKREAALGNLQFGDFMDLLIFGVLNPRVSESTTIISLGTSLGLNGKIYYPFIGGQQDICTVLGILSEDEILRVNEYVFIVKS
ncbi:MAG: hypothetical protein WCY43_00065 [Patescibacteria group bacterium]|nr:hypothetical protein [Patescibacteria group bacterium]